MVMKKTKRIHLVSSSVYLRVFVYKIVFHRENIHKSCTVYEIRFNIPISSKYQN